MKKLILLAMVVLLIGGCATTKSTSLDCRRNVHTVSMAAPACDSDDSSFLSRFFKWFGERLEAEWKELLDIALDPDLNA